MNWMKELRSKTGLSQHKLAEAIGIPVKNIQNWESGFREPPEWTKEMIAFWIEHKLQSKEKGSD